MIQLGSGMEVYIHNFVGGPAGTRPLGRSRRRWEDLFIMDIEEIRCGSGLHLAGSV